MIISLISFILDLMILNLTKYNHGVMLMFPMFTVVYLLSSIYFRKDYLINYFTLSLYFSLTGLLIYPLFFYLFEFYFIRKDLKNFNIKDYLLKILSALILFDSLFFLLRELPVLNSYKFSLLFNKIIITIPINILYSIIIFYINKVLKKQKKKYKLVWLI